MLHQMQLLSPYMALNQLFNIINDYQLKPEERDNQAEAALALIKELNQEFPKLKPFYEKFCAKTNGAFTTSDANFFIDLNVAIREMTCLMLAAQSGYLNIVKMLIEAKANPLCDVNGKTALYNSVYQGHKDTVDYLLEQKASVEHCPHQTSLAHIAAEQGHAGILKKLLDHNAPIDERDHSQRTALMLAVRNNGKDRSDCIRVLLDNNADVEAQDNQQQNTVAYLTTYRNVKNTQVFLQAGKIPQAIAWTLFQGFDCSKPDLYFCLTVCVPHLPPEAGKFLQELTAIKLLVEYEFQGHRKYLREFVARIFAGSNVGDVIFEYAYYPLETMGLFQFADLKETREKFVKDHQTPVAPPKPATVATRTRWW
jgi:ankyrin repeat protein